MQVKSRTRHTQKRKVIANDAASKLFKQQMYKLDDEYNELMNKEKKCYSRCNISNLFLSDYNYDDEFVLPLIGDEKLPLIQSLEDDE